MNRARIGFAARLAAIVLAVAVPTLILAASTVLQLDDSIATQRNEIQAAHMLRVARYVLDEDPARAKLDIVWASVPLYARPENIARFERARLVFDRPTPATDRMLAIRRIFTTLPEWSNIGYDADPLVQNLVDLLCLAQQRYIARVDVADTTIRELSDGTMPILKDRVSLAVMHAQIITDANIVKDDAKPAFAAMPWISRKERASVETLQKSVYDYAEILSTFAIAPQSAVGIKNRSRGAVRNIHAQLVPARDFLFRELDARLASNLAEAESKRTRAILFSLVAIVVGSLIIVSIVREMLTRESDARKRAELESARLAAQVSAIEADRARRAIEARFQVVFDLADIGIAIFDDRLALVDANPALNAMVDERERIEVAQIVRSMLPEGKGTARMEYAFVRTGGPTLWTDFIVSPVVVEGGARYSICMLSDITQRKVDEDRLRHAASHDALTGALNRRAFEESLESSFAAARGEGKPFGLIFVDLDHFKEVNDSLGHDAGDAILQAVAERLRATSPPGSVVARLGGDEFALVVTALDATYAETLLEHLRSSIAIPLAWNNTPLFPSASFGCAFYNSEVRNPSELMRSADAAMYEAKRRGRVSAQGGERLD